MTQRDRSILVVLGVLALVAGFWFVVLGPKRKQLHKLDAEVTKSQQDLEATRGEAQQFAQDRLLFPRTYATVVRLGKAAPEDPDVPSLLVQLENAAARAGVDFRKIALETSGQPAAAATPTPPAPAPPATGTTGPSGSQAGGASAGGTTGQSGAQSGASGSSQAGGGASTPAGGATGSAGASTAGSTAATAPAPADAVTAATVPIGTEVGPAQLPTLRFTLIFQGNFFKMAGFIHNVRSLVKKRGNRLMVSGRLLTIDAITFKEGDFGFPQVKASIAATAYVLPETQGLLGGATPQGPGGATAATPAPVSTPGASTPPAAVVTTP